MPDESALAPIINGIGGANYNTAAGLPYPGFHSINLSTNEANSHYNGLQIDLSSQVGKDLTLRAFYTLSRTIDPGAGNGGQDLQNVSNPYAGWLYDVGPGGYDRTHNASVNFIYDIPVFRHTENRLLRATLGGWEVSGIVTITSGLPINPQLTGGQSGNALPNANNRPDQVGSVSYPHTSASGSARRRSRCPPLAAFGDAGHNSLRGPGSR